METRLQQRLQDLARLRNRARLWRTLAVCWAVAAALGLLLLLIQGIAGRQFDHAWLFPLVIGAVLGGIVFLKTKQRGRQQTGKQIFGGTKAVSLSPAEGERAGVRGEMPATNDKSSVTDLCPPPHPNPLPLGGGEGIANLIQELEPSRPEVRNLLLAAAEQKPETGAFGFLQLRVIEEALAHPGHEDWLKKIQRRLRGAQVANVFALIALVAIAFALHRGPTSGAASFGSFAGEEITVTPGDAQVERGSGLVIAARFGSAPPAEVTLVLNSASGKEARRPMARRLADPVFGTSIPEVAEAGVYRVEYRGKKTRDFKIAVFEFPALVRADAQLHYPPYTGLTNRTIRDTLRVSAVEGSRLAYTLQLNKPVARARLVGGQESLALSVQSNAVATLPEFPLTRSARYSLELVDADGRTNKFPPDFVFLALTNQRPVVKLVFPHGDTRVSKLEELQLRAEASDDFGLLKYGFGFGLAGQEPQLVELGQFAPANTKRQFDYLISLEKLGVDVDQSVTYFAWAEDFGPDGQPRRTFSDMFFADVRPFEEIFRPDQSGAGADENQNGRQVAGGNQRARLAELQKQIVVATWNLQREKTGAAGRPTP